MQFLYLDKMKYVCLILTLTHLEYLCNYGIDFVNVDHFSRFVVLFFISVVLLLGFSQLFFILRLGEVLFSPAV